MTSVDGDAELLVLAKTRDERAFTALVQPHRRVMWAVCLRITRHQADAEDALQDALIAAWRHLPGFRGESRLSTWLYRIASNAALAVVRRRRETTELDEGTAWSPDFGDAVAVQDDVQRALAGVPPDFRAALVLREFGGMTYEEIAEHQGIRVETVKTRIHRARTALRAALVESV